MNYSQKTHCGTLSRAEAAARRSAGESVASLAAAAGVSPATLYLALHDWGITTPRGGDRRSGEWRQRFAQRIGGAA